VDSDQARAILSIYRPGIDDNDPQFAEALAQAARDPELAAWLGRHRQHYADVRQKLRGLAVPDELAETIVRERPIPFHWPAISIPTWQMAAAVALMAALAGFFAHDLSSRDKSARNRAAGARLTEGSTITVTGEVLDMACYIASNLSGPEHAECARTWAGGGEPQGLPLVPGDTGAPAAASRDVFMFMINGAKERAPAAAMGVLAALKAP